MAEFNLDYETPLSPADIITEKQYYEFRGERLFKEELRAQTVGLLAIKRVLKKETSYLVAEFNISALTPRHKLGALSVGPDLIIVTGYHKDESDEIIPKLLHINSSNIAEHIHDDKLTEYGYFLTTMSESGPDSIDAVSYQLQNSIASRA